MWLSPAFRKQLLALAKEVRARPSSRRGPYTITDAELDEVIVALTLDGNGEQTEQMSGHNERFIASVVDQW